MAVIATDNFTDTDGVFLENHTPDTGSGWSVSAAERLKIISNELGDNVGGGPAIARKGDDMTQDDVKCQADCKIGSAGANNHSMVATRMGNADFLGFFGGIEGSVVTARAVIMLDSTVVADTGVDSRALSTVFKYRLEAKNNGADTDLELFENDVSILTHTETATPKQGTSFRRAGIRKRRTGTTMDTWSSETIVAAPAAVDFPLIVNPSAMI